jgi:hypothetical protein
LAPGAGPGRDNVPSRSASRHQADSLADGLTAFPLWRRAGFRPISKEALPVPYAYPDRHSLLLMLRLDTDSVGNDTAGGEGRA